MSDETEETSGPLPPHRVIGTPPPSPTLLGPDDGRDGEPGHGSEVAHTEEFAVHLPSESDDPERASRAEKVVAALFTLAFIAGCGFIAAYIGLEVGCLDATLRSNLALGTSLAVALLALGLGALIWVRYIMPDAEVDEERHEMRSDPADREAFGEVLQGRRGGQPVRQAPAAAAQPDARHAAAAGRAARAAPRPGPAARAPACGTRCGAPAGGCWSTAPTSRSPRLSSVRPAA